MEKEAQNHKPLVEQVVDEWLYALNREEGFDDKIIMELKELSKNSGIKEADRLIEAIKPTPGVKK